MDPIENRKAKARLKRYLKDFPWLWAILQRWHQWDVNVRVRQIESSSTCIMRVDYSPEIQFQFWIEGENTLMGKDEPADEIRNCTPDEGTHTLHSLIAKSKDSGCFHPEFAIYVYQNGNKKEIVIFRPPKPQKFF